MRLDNPYSDFSFSVNNAFSFSVIPTGKYLRWHMSQTSLITCSTADQHIRYYSANNVLCWTVLFTLLKKYKSWTVLKGGVVTCRACSRSSRVCDAEMQIRALESSNGVAGNATVTTATCRYIQEYTSFPEKSWLQVQCGCRLWFRGGLTGPKMPEWWINCHQGASATHIDWQVSNTYAA